MISLTRKIMPQGCLHLVGSFVSSSGLFEAQQNNNLTSHIPFELMWVEILFSKRHKKILHVKFIVQDIYALAGL